MLNKLYDEKIEKEAQEKKMLALINPIQQYLNILNKQDKIQDKSMQDGSSQEIINFSDNIKGDENTHEESDGHRQTCSEKKIAIRTYLENYRKFIKNC